MLTSRQQPEQLELLSTVVRLTKVALERNQRCFYLVRTAPTLFGELLRNEKIRNCAEITNICSAQGLKHLAGALAKRTI